MDYQSVYDKIIQNAKSRKATGYTEKHHIIPKSLGGSDTKTNLVELTAREHFICHWLLYKIYKDDKFNGPKMLKAFGMMLNVKNSTQCRYKSGVSVLYEKFKIALSNHRKNHSVGVLNTQYGTRWIVNSENTESRKIHKDDAIPYGWVYGRLKKIQTNSTTRECKVCKGLVYGRSITCGKICKSIRASELSKESAKYRDFTNNSRSKQCSIAGVVYKSIGEASRVTGIHAETLRMRIKSATFDDYFFI